MLKINADITFIRSREPENMSLEASFLKMVAKATKALIIVETGTYLVPEAQKNGALCLIRFIDRTRNRII